jgi:hypothetical protein
VESTKRKWPEAGCPLVVGRTDGIEPEHIGTGSDARRGLDELGVLAGKDRCDRLAIERLAQLEPGDEVSHGRAVSRESWAVNRESRLPTGVISSRHTPVGRHHGMNIGATYVRGYRRVFHSSARGFSS